MNGIPVAESWAFSGVFGEVDMGHYLLRMVSTWLRSENR